MRTPEEFTAEMLKKKNYSWSSILAVARVIRDGKWRSRVREILVEKGLIPEDREEELRQRDAIVNKQAAEKKKKEENDRAAKHKSPPGIRINMPGRNLLAGSEMVARFQSKGEKDGPKEDKPSGGVSRSRKKPGGNG